MLLPSSFLALKSDEQQNTVSKAAKMKMAPAGGTLLQYFTLSVYRMAINWRTSKVTTIAHPSVCQLPCPLVTPWWQDMQRCLHTSGSCAHQPPWTRCTWPHRAFQSKTPKKYKGFWGTAFPLLLRQIHTLLFKKSGNTIPEVGKIFPW